MTWYEDLGPLDYFDVDDLVPLRAVGWLSKKHDYPRGEIDIGLYKKLRELLESPFQPVVLMGFHECNLCQFGGQMGQANLWVPGSDCLYVAPELVIHYIDAHHYLPPKEFLDAVVACPDTRSMAYKKAFLASGGREFVKSGSRRAREFQENFAKGKETG